MRIRYWCLFSLLVLVLCACQVETGSAEPSPKSTQFVWPTATYRTFATIAPDNVATATPTPTLKPLRNQPQGQIAFQSNLYGSLDIYVMNADGTLISRLTNDPGVDVYPSWSPDGTQIAFTSDMDGNPDIYVINADGTNMTRIVEDLANDVLPAWSPDGESIAFVSDRDGNNEIYTMNLDGSNLKRLTINSGDDFFPSWSPDGEWIVFSSTRDVNSELYKMDKNGGNLIRLTDDPAADSTPAWSPDGTRIAFVSKRDGFANLYVMDSDGKDAIQLTDFKSTVEVPSWSLDSQMIAFASDMEISYDVFIISADGTGLDRVTTDAGEEFYPAWSPKLDFLTETVDEPTAAPDSVCFNAVDPTYGFSIENPIRLGYDPREGSDSETGCIPWLLGPQGQSLTVKLLEEIDTEEGNICKVSVSYEGQAEPDVFYFDTNTYEQPKAPIGYSCGSPVEYLKAITSARYQ